MKDIPLTNYQLIAFFIPGQLFVFSYFIACENIKNIGSLVSCLQSVNIGFLLVSVAMSFLVGLVFDAIRNGCIEKCFDKCEKNKSKKMNWDFFYTGKKDDVGVFYGRYFTYYCFDFNLILSLISSLILIDGYSSLEYKYAITVTVILSIGFLIRDGISLRNDMIDVTNYKKNTP
ncbi:MAG TPA: hypothetical protein VK705_10675 [Ferruginibacter sp.]|jgi:hypothetical protein|nr:hypothetical protein [Ferruginibacter sp.]